MAVNSVNSTGANDNPASAVFSALNGTQKSAGTGANAVSDQQNRFLTLLTTQLKNQDPLNPMDNAQMTSQMAQISTVDGIERLNATLQTLINDSSKSQALQAASLVGKDVLVPGSALPLVNGAGIAGFELTGAADDVQIQIKNANAQVVRTLHLGAQNAGVQVFSWDGKSDAGDSVTDGAYTFAVNAKQGQNKVTATALNHGAVSGVGNGSNGVDVDVGKLGSFGIADVKQIM